MSDHYRTLGVEPEATAGEIRRAYLRLARVHHPDHHVADAAEERARHEDRMRLVNRAWAVLGDPDRRSAYDRNRRRGSGDGTARRSDGRHPGMPDGPGWTPRADDTAWMDDFAAWRDEDGRLPPDPPGEGLGPTVLLPVLLVVAGFVVGFVGVALSSRLLMAIAAIAFVLAVLVFVALFARELARSRASDRRR